MLMAFLHLFPPATAISTAIASWFETHRFAMLLQDKVSGEAAMIRTNRKNANASRAFSSEVDAGSREENASKQKIRARF